MTNTTRFALCTEIGANFTFDAKDLASAEARATEWAAYQGFTFYPADSKFASRSEITVRAAQGNELNWNPRNK